MTAFAKLYCFPNNPRARVALVAAKYEDLELDVVNVRATAELPAEFTASFPLGLIPALEKGSFKLTESAAIATYIASYHNKHGLAGTTKEDAASVQQWMAWGNAHFLRSLAEWFAPLAGLSAYNKVAVEAAKASTLKQSAYLEKYLADKTFLVGHRVTVADIFVASVVVRGVGSVFDAEYRTAHPNIFRFYNTIIHQAPFFAVLGSEPTMVQHAITYTPPPKADKAAKATDAPYAEVAAKAAKAPKAPKAPKAKEDDEEEEPAVVEPKAKHPCETLGAAKSFPLDEFKRQYSNNETPVAMKWLEENFDAQDYSLWKVTYKYPEELTQVFMSANLVGGFHTRLEGSRKYLFGSAAVYGENNDSKIAGAYMIRGSNPTHVFDVAPDFESYEYSPLDIKADREFIEGCWAWTNEFEGKKFADGKVFK